MTEECYEMTIEFPKKVGPDKYDPNMKITVKTIKPPSLHGYVTGDEKMKLDSEMAKECWNSINTAMYEGKEMGFIPDDKPTERPLEQRQEEPLPTHHETGQSSLDARETHTTSSCSGDWAPSSKQMNYMAQLKSYGVKHHDKYTEMVAAYGKHNPSDLTGPEVSNIIGILKEIKE